MRNHLKSRHQISVESAPIHQLQQLYIKAQSFGQTQNIDTKVFQRILSQDVIDEAIEQSWQAQKDIVQKKLQSASLSIHLSLDIWTSPNRILFLGICAHFVEQTQEKLCKGLLALRTVGNHSGDEQFATLLPVLKDYGTQQKIGSIICDNHTTNDKLCRVLGNYLQEEEGITWNSTYRRIFCIGHVINLAMQAFLFQNMLEMKQLSSWDEIETTEDEGQEEDKLQRQATIHKIGPLGKLHNIVTHVRGSADRTKEFKDLAGRLIPLDNRTKWNSWYYMLHVALQFDGAINTYTKRHFAVLKTEYLSPLDWEMLHRTSKFLSLFDRATLKTQGDQATIDNVLFVMDIIIKHFEKALIQNGELEKELAKACITEGEEALGGVSAKTPNYMVIQSYERNTQDLNDFDLITQDLGKFARPASQDKYEDYNSESPYKVRMSALTWWCQDQQQKRWPRLSYMAIDILSIPAMSDEPERAFSGARRTISWERVQLSAENIERIECLKTGKRVGLQRRNTS
ncbi:hypothetical protein TSTA_008550 [Talaromyces stipitatus ATCC 10500]|uniref:HAT C-terminal dimerisation domain-containing protein n=1 Tax=Talaromyces stipitatus (strain ATCC 10500 / CBS 375.48 / QM 6759 / NRRL 1006) TaxID=441959 RepID=B8MVA3_TALSN|nr:uncharacterized protein TSTA_008550 [Talaromyces stipitatus ATCC 10500]EED11559.1 hypothetical protein TSTA_008550 [Talaromyces stipitatus ATCC 10500]